MDANLFSSDLYAKVDLSKKRRNELAGIKAGSPLQSDYDTAMYAVVDKTIIQPQEEVKEQEILNENLDNISSTQATKDQDKVTALNGATSFSFTGTHLTILRCKINVLFILAIALIFMMGMMIVLFAIAFAKVNALESSQKLQNEMFNISAGNI